MSKSVRRGRDHDINVFNSSAQVTSQEATDAIFSSGTLDIAEHRQVAKPVSIFDIYPDFTQPRRIIPSAIRHFWTGEPESLRHLFDKWIKAVEGEKQENFDIYPYLAQSYLADKDKVEQEPISDETDNVSPFGPIETSLIQIAGLAADIRHIGLTNPITIVKSGQFYRLETGERRWMAYHLLNIYFPDGQWSKIPARVVEQASVWRQASENNARADLNAIGKARQLAILIMDLLSQRGYAFESFDTIVGVGRSEREYYAQVADGEEFRIPRGSGEKLLAAMGLKNPVQLRQYRALLKLSNEVWEYADDNNLKEYEIRGIDRDTVSPVTVSGDGDSVSRVTVSDNSNPFLEPINKKRIGKIWSYAAKLELLNDQDREKALQTIEEHERWLDELKRAIRDNRKWNGR